ncbi:carboxy-terminal kinesin 2-like isoform X2 [Haliotis rubra]|uniref:carboxy-terminal kinesin 2-like isoform X2 n=1 Tax=Haliotis rubra TaxID=36100 RepID=UPI001EE5C72D|nr:carboxy-terminal kinesin 2-like isoform X2 [Haliotis rubra]
MYFQRKPLATKNIGGSKLPMPGSRLKPPQSVSVKRSRSSEEDSAIVSNPNPGKKFRSEAPPAKMNRSVSVSSLNSTRPTRPTNTSQRRPPARPTSRSNANLSITISGPPSKCAPPKKPAPGPTVPKAAAAGGKKRAAWDLKGRLHDMEQVLQHRDQISSSLQTQLESYNNRINTLESQNMQLSGTVAEKEQLSSEVYKENQEVIRKLRATQDEMDDMKRKFQREIEDLNYSKSSLQRQKENLEGEVSAYQKEVSGLKSSIAEVSSAQAKIGAELEATKLGLSQSEARGREKDTENSRLNSVIAELERVVEEQNRQKREHETERRKLHNLVQELKGNIRVFCRIRPLLGDETLVNDGMIHHMNFPDLDGRVLELEKLGDASLNESSLAASRRGQNKYDFAFDKVFQPETTQSQVFEEIAQLVQSALDGYNVCIFAYGQTGSGKTYTMEGGSVDDDLTMGMIPRAVQQVFSTARDLEEKGWQYQFDASMLEIYNETIRDLLSDEELKHEIKMTGNGSSETIVTNLTVISVRTESQIHKLLKKATHNRAVAETKCNERSSRSHSVFQLKLRGSNELTGENCSGILSLVDLAGSERVKDSGSEGQRLKEALAINKSLSNLGNVIMALGNKDNHVPYRNSKLTYLLQNSLGGNSKTLMFVNVSPKEECFQETLNSLRFATKVNQCNIGTAQKKAK